MENDLNNSTSEDLTYQGIADGIMDELQQKYNLRPRNRSVTSTQKKNILPRRETDKIVSKDVEKHIVKIDQTDTQPTKTKVAETLTVKTLKVKAPATETKPSP